MWKSVTVRNFRSLDHLSVESLGRVNLITGANDSGKTTLLEALFLLLGETNSGLVPRLNAMRGLNRAHGEPAEISDWLMLPLFHRFDTNRQIELSALDVDEVQSSLTIQYRPDSEARLSFDSTSSSGMVGSSTQAVGRLELTFMKTDVEGLIESRPGTLRLEGEGFIVEPSPRQTTRRAFFLGSRAPDSPADEARFLGQIEEHKQGFDELTEAMRIIEPNLLRITTVVGVGGPMIYADVRLPRLLPLSLLGDGLGRLTAILLRIAVSEGGVVLVDEIENGLHHSVLPRIWGSIITACRRFNVQLFATTHSWECIAAAREALAEDPIYDLSLHRLERTKRFGLRAVHYRRDLLDAAIQADFEVR